jgi:hypothetical protein
VLRVHETFSEWVGSICERCKNNETPAGLSITIPWMGSLRVNHGGKSMPAFTVTMELKGAGERTFTMYGTDRDEVIEFCKKAFRKIFKGVKSCKKIKVIAEG